MITVFCKILVYKTLFAVLQKIFPSIPDKPNTINNIIIFLAINLDILPQSHFVHPGIVSFLSLLHINV